jgi:hypothetical protein
MLPCLTKTFHHASKALQNFLKDKIKNLWIGMTFSTAYRNMISKMRN